MILLIFRFPGRRYHATPWGHHVNEGLVEWPPSPWRLLRAFMATAFTKLSVPDPVPPDHPLRRLVETLAAALPSFRLPSSSATHSRHYLPLAEKSEKKTLVLDAWLRPDATPLLVRWPVDLAPDCHDLLARIMESISYLGRAESWVEGALISPTVDSLDGIWAQPDGPGIGGGPGWEQVALLAPVAAEDYSRTRDQARDAIELKYPLPPSSRKGASQVQKNRSRALEAYPADLFECLSKDTAFFQEHGWTQPPGSRRVPYWKLSAPFSETASPPSFSTDRRSAGPRVEAILLALASNTRRREVLPPLSRALPQAELLHRSLVSQIGDPKEPPCPVFTGRSPTGAPLTGHQHAHLVPLNLEPDSPDRLDHFLLWAPMGFDDRAREIALAVRRTWTKGGDQPLFVTVSGMGSRDDLRCLIERHVLGPAHIWISRTPFVPPRHLKPSGPNSLVNQVRAELASRRLPDARVEVLDREEVARLHFHRFVRVRRDRQKAPPQDSFVGLRLTFAEPVHGPIALGYASHFGLGLFAPLENPPLSPPPDGTSL